MPTSAPTRMSEEDDRNPRRRYRSGTSSTLSSHRTSDNRTGTRSNGYRLIGSSGSRGSSLMTTPNRTVDTTEVKMDYRREGNTGTFCWSGRANRNRTGDKTHHGTGNSFSFFI